MIRLRVDALLCGLFLIVLIVSPCLAGDVEFHVRYEPTVSEGPVSCRVFVKLDNRYYSKPYSTAHIFHPHPIYAIDVEDWRPGETVVLDDKAAYLIEPMDDLAGRRFVFQAIMDINNIEWGATEAPGNGISQVVLRKLERSGKNVVELVIDEVIQEREFGETERVKEVVFRSERLSDFSQRDVNMKASVVLPPGYNDQPEQKYPVVYIVPGFSGNHHNPERRTRGLDLSAEQTQRIYVVLSPMIQSGHCSFADSDNNGPWGSALVEELIPHLETRFRIVSDPSARLLRGHSSGGWSTLWLQITYPEFFGGVWATSPDAVDFRAMTVNIYESGANYYRDGNGDPRPAMIRDGQVALTNEESIAEEIILGEGGQMDTYEAVHGPKGPDGKPRPLFDRETGAIDHDVALAWRRYDIRFILESNTDNLVDRLQGKIFAYTGGEDSFLLHKPFALFKKALERLGSDAVVELSPGEHFGFPGRDLERRIAEQIDERLQQATLNLE